MNSKNQNQTPARQSVESSELLAIGDGATVSISPRTDGVVIIEIKTTALGLIKLAMPNQNFTNALFGKSEQYANVESVRKNRKPIFTS